MAPNNNQRHQRITRLVTQRRDLVAQVSIDLWQRLASELVSIIGEGGFQSLFSRSVQLTSLAYPWIAPVHVWLPAKAQFPDLQASLAEHEFIEASEASVSLLVTFSDVLAALIGDTLTNSILTSAWGDEAPGVSDKEVPI